MNAPKRFSIIAEILRHQILPAVHNFGMNNIAVAYPTLHKMQTMQSVLPHNITLTPKPLKSSPETLNEKWGHEISAIARWIEDGLHSKREPILMFAVKGRIAIPLGNYVLHCTPGHGTLILPGTPHPDGSHTCLESYDREREPNEMLSFTVRGNSVCCWLSHSHKDQHWSGNISAGESCFIINPQARFYLEELSRAAQDCEASSRIIADGMLRIFIGTTLQEIENSRMLRSPLIIDKIIDGDKESSSSPNLVITQIEQYVRNHLGKPLSIDQMASYLYMSRASFTTFFRHTTGKTFNVYLTELRLETAKVLLLETYWTVERISDYVGITSARLRKLFKQHEHCTPLEYRQNKKQK